MTNQVDGIVDVVILTYKPEPDFLQTLQRLKTQSVAVRKVHIINTEKALWERYLKTCKLTEESFVEQFPNTDITHVSKTRFDHGGSRNLGARKCEDADYMVMMTQDAMPADCELIQELLAGFLVDDKIAVVHGRQLPREDAKTEEIFTRKFNYPAASELKSQQDIGRLGIKAYFGSNVCACYRMDIFHELGGFVAPTIFNEDMIYTGRALQNGYKSYYAAKAMVIHSHHYTPSEQFHRNFDLGVSQAEHPEIFQSAKSEGEGVRYVKAVTGYMKDTGHAAEIPGFIIGCACRLVGFKMGKKFASLPLSLVKWCTMNKEYWNQK